MEKIKIKKESKEMNLTLSSSVFVLGDTIFNDTLC